MTNVLLTTVGKGVDQALLQSERKTLPLMKAAQEAFHIASCFALPRTGHNLYLP
jgi:hypothetical protein